MKNKKAILIGALVIVFAALTLGLSSCASRNYETKTIEITKSFTKIIADIDVGDFCIRESDDGECRVELYENEKIKYSVSEENGVLTVKLDDTRKWYDFIFSSGNCEVTVYLPSVWYSELTVEVDTGDVEISNAKVNDIDISVDTGDAKLCDVECDKLAIETDTGDAILENVFSRGEVALLTDTGDVKCADVKCVQFSVEVETGRVSLQNVVSRGTFTVNSETGNVDFSGCDAGAVFITTGTGDVKGSFLTKKIIFAETETGDIDIPKLTIGGKCEITTDTGDIEITIKN